MDEIDFYNKVKPILNTKITKIEYNKKLKVENETALNMVKKYDLAYSNSNYPNKINSQISICPSASNSDVFIGCLEVLDWGGMAKGSLNSLLNLQKSSGTRDYVIELKAYFENDDDEVKLKNKPIFNSGWTKIYSLYADFTVIYDSRVAAYLNFILLEIYSALTNDQQEKIKSKVTSKLMSTVANTAIAGTVRSRYIGKHNAAKLELKGSLSGKSGIKANKIASWVVKYIAYKYYNVTEDILTQKQFREFDKLFFMMGFDLNALDFKP